jgi:hypothetical protein
MRVERLARGGDGAAVGTEQAPAPLAYEVFICVESGHLALLIFGWEHMFASATAEKRHT